MCELDCRSDPVLDYFLHLTQGLGLDARGIVARWQKAGVTHVLLSQRGYEYVLDLGFDPISSTDRATLETLQRDHLELIAETGDAYLLYRLR